MIDIEKAILAGKSIKAGHEKKAQEEAKQKAFLVAKAREMEIAQLQTDAQRVVEGLYIRIAWVVGQGETKVELHAKPSRILTNWNNPKVQEKDVPELWLFIIEECKKHGVKAQILHSSYEDHRYNDMGGVEDSWTQYYSYIGIDTEDYKL